ncbi:MAG: murein biosynthesis integral membrane protein MurJ [Fibrobacteraceae bacterium]
MNKATLIIAASMLLSRVLGILREMLLARAAGVTAEKNALDLAFLIPDILNHVVSTGFLSIVFIPIFFSYKVRHDEEGSWKFFSNILNTLGLFFLILIIPSFIWMRELITLFTSAADLPAAILDRATYFGRIILPGQLFIFAGSFLVAVQHTRKQFTIPSLTGVIYNLAIIVGGIIGSRYGLAGFAWGVPIGAFIGFFLFQIIGARRGGVHYFFYLNPKHPDVIRYVKMMVPMSLGVGSMFAFDFIIRCFGGVFGASGISSLNYAYRVMYTLVAVFGFSVGVSSYPDMARLVKENNYNELNKKIWSSLSRMFVILIPAVITVWALAFPIVRILFERGAFARETTEFVSTLLHWYLPASLGLCLQAVLVRSFYAKEKMWTPTLINTGIFALTIPAYWLFAKPLGIYVVPIVGATGAIVQVLSMVSFWVRSNGTSGMFHAVKNISLALISFAVMIAISIGIEHFSADFVRNASIWAVIVYAGIVALVLFPLTLLIQKTIGSDDARDILQELLGRIANKLHLQKI